MKIILQIVFLSLNVSAHAEKPRRPPALKTADTVEELTTDGLYLVGDSVWAVIGGTKVQLSGDSTTTYVSYLAEQKDVTGEQKERALTNIGFYYNTLEDAQNSGLTSGIVYVQGDNKLYIIKDGVVSEYGITLNNSQNFEEAEKLLEKLYIQDYSLMVDGEEYAKFDNNNIQLNKITYFKEGINSYGANASYGYRLYIKDGKSYLEVDNIIERNKKVDAGNINIQKIKYHQDENIIIGINSEDNIVLNLLYSDKYKVGDILTTSILLEKEIITTEGDEQIEILEQVLVPIDFKIDSISSDKKEYTVTILSEEQELVQNNIQNLLNKSIYYKQGELPVARISDHNYDLFEPNVDQTLENINLRIGSLQELEVSLLGEKISKYTKEDLGIYSDNTVFKKSQLINPEIYISETEQYNNITTKIGYIAAIPIASGVIADYSDIDMGLYSDNAFLKDSRLFSSIQYNTEFRNLNNIYPKYAEGWYIPDDSDDQTIVTSLWVNDQLDPIKEEIDDIWDALDEKEDSGSDNNGASSDDIADLQEQIDSLSEQLKLIQLGPQILISGTVYRNDANSLTWYFNGISHNDLALDPTQALTTTINGGVLQITWSSNRRIAFDGCCANMQTSGLVTSYTSQEYQKLVRQMQIQNMLKIADGM